MPTTLRRAITTVAAAAIALGTVALQPAEARKHDNQTGAVILGTLAALALMAAANEYRYPYYGYSTGYQGHPYGPGYPYWNGHRYVYGPVYGGPVPVPPSFYWR
jgi:hypothetical protein